MDYMANPLRRNSAGYINTSSAYHGPVSNAGHDGAAGNAGVASSQYTESARLAIIQNRNSTGSMAGPFYNPANAMYHQHPMVDQYGHAAAPVYGVIPEERNHIPAIQPALHMAHHHQPQLHPSQQAQLHAQQAQLHQAQLQQAQAHAQAESEAQSQAQVLASPNRNYALLKQRTMSKRCACDESSYCNNGDGIDPEYSQSQRQAFPTTVAASSERQADPYTIDSRISGDSPHSSYPYSPMTSVSPSSPKGSLSHNPWSSPPMGTPNASLSSRRSSPLRQSQTQSSGYARASSRTPQQLARGSLSQESPVRQQVIHDPHSAGRQASMHMYQQGHQQPQQQQSQQQVPPPTIPAPVFRRIRSKSDLAPVAHYQPKYRRAMPEGGFMSPLNALTSNLATTYQICNPAFNYQSSKNPRRVLTKPSEGKLNNGYDNVDSDYILYVNDILGTDEQRRYLVLDILGQGTFGQVVKCQNMITKEIVAVKVIKNKPAYLNQSMMEVSILDHLNTHVDKLDEHNLLRLKDKFIHKEHLCLVFELLSSNLYELIKQNQFRGLSTNLVRVFTQQLLDSLIVLHEARLIHCDLKPENILLKSLDSPIIKVIDFGSACHERQTVYTYIQSRFYRSPEVILGLPYTTSIDMWSLGCIVAELFLGLPIFPGTSEYNQLSRITETLGNPPNWMIEMGKNAGQFMEKYIDEYGRKQYRLKSREKYSQEYNTDEQPSKQYFPSTNLREIVMRYPLPRRNMKKADIDREMQNRVAFVDFVQGLLNLNPFERWTPQQAAVHPFITESKFNGPFVPSMAAGRDRGHAPGTTPSSVGGTSWAIGGGQSTSSRRYGGPTTTTTSQTGVPTIKIDGPQQESGGSGMTHSYYNNGMSQPPSLGHGAQQFQSQSQSRRSRATTIGQMDTIPGPIQRATALMNPNQPIRAQPSPAYIPPPDLYHHSSDRHKQSSYGDVVRNLEDGLSYMS